MAQRLSSCSAPPSPSKPRHSPSFAPLADALKKIWPSVNASAHRIGIPMPGHAVGDREQASVRADCEKLEQLVSEHDVVFLLTDTRGEAIRRGTIHRGSPPHLRFSPRLPWRASPACRRSQPLPTNPPRDTHDAATPQEFPTTFPRDTPATLPRHSPTIPHGSPRVLVESRWLPTLLAAKLGKQAINAALGFDSLMVMRHGQPAAPDADAAVAGSRGRSSGAHLGCYFCNDVVAPANSMLRRTLDQQCTVSRPGLSMIASALAVELMVTVLHHPAGGAAEADLGGGLEARGRSESCLGCVPHQLRASLPMFRVDAMVGRSFDKCTACSAIVLEAYGAGGFEFLLSAFNRATYLEDLTGLTQMHAETEAALEDVDVFDEDDEGD